MNNDWQNITVYDDGVEVRDRPRGELLLMRLLILGAIGLCVFELLGLIKWLIHVFVG